MLLQVGAKIFKSSLVAKKNTYYGFLALHSCQRLRFSHVIFLTVRTQKNTKWSKATLLKSS